jgi:hypothetical protein
MLRHSRTFGMISLLILGCLATAALRSLADCGIAGKPGDPDKSLAPFSMVVGDEPGTVPEAAVTVKIREVRTQGGLAPAAIREGLNAELAKLARSCQDAVQRGYQLPATITLVFAVGTDGQVRGEPLGKPPLADQGFEKCLAATFKSLQFPKPKRAAAQVTVKLALAAP